MSRSFDVLFHDRCRVLNHASLFELVLELFVLRP